MPNALIGTFLFLLIYHYVGIFYVHFIPYGFLRFHGDFSRDASRQIINWVRFVCIPHLSVEITFLWANVRDVFSQWF
jgi:hypothetical protein